MKKTKVASVEEPASSASPEIAAFSKSINATSKTAFHKLVSNSWSQDLVQGDVLYTSFETGGVQGGGWRDDSTTERYTKSYDAEFHALDSALEMICPEITFLQYKKLLRSDIIKTTEFTENEYYGNSTDYSVKYVETEKLFNYLKDNNLLSELKVESQSIAKGRVLGAI